MLDGVTRAPLPSRGIPVKSATTRDEVSLVLDGGEEVGDNGVVRERKRDEGW